MPKDTSEEWELSFKFEDGIYRCIAAINCTVEDQGPCRYQSRKKTDCKRHLNIKKHANHKAYTCPSEGCKKTFGQPNALTIHLNIHSGRTPYGCRTTGCDERFGDPSARKRHEGKCNGLSPRRTGNLDVSSPSSSYDTNLLDDGGCTERTRQPLGDSRSRVSNASGSMEEDDGLSSAVRWYDQIPSQDASGLHVTSSVSTPLTQTPALLDPRLFTVAESQRIVEGAQPPNYFCPSWAQAGMGNVSPHILLTPSTSLPFPILRTPFEEPSTVNVTSPTGSYCWGVHQPSNPDLCFGVMDGARPQWAEVRHNQSTSPSGGYMAPGVQFGPLAIDAPRQCNLAYVPMSTTAAIDQDSTPQSTSFPLDRHGGVPNVLNTSTNYEGWGAATSSQDLNTTMPTMNAQVCGDDVFPPFTSCEGLLPDFVLSDLDTGGEQRSRAPDCHDAIPGTDSFVNFRIPDDVWDSLALWADSYLESRPPAHT
ncbi:hypothetical protein BD410DRAFT_841202 [Rickenella mellea]|uniref:C2H2-type domain-containing protein n=1 Tax=Rickenella mellea TaxID=50990 RepID=A0A4Y7PZS5_9AGAM|nr:hypothetical protein BD410DRAFT_841202 [Rickenella mellea]